MAKLAEDNLDFAAAPQLEPAPDSAPVRAPSMAANASAFIIPQIAPEDCEPDPLADDTGPIDVFNDGGGKPGKEESADKKSKRFFLELSALNNIGGNGGGPLNQETPEERQARLRAEIDRLFEEVKEREERLEREREFDAKMHQIGSYQFSGKELMQMRDWLQDEKHQEEFENDLMTKHGISKEEAKRRRLELQEALELKKKEREGTLTPEEKRRMELLLAKPTVGEDMKIVQERDKKQRAMSVGALNTKSDNEYVATYQDAFKVNGDDKKLLAAQIQNEPVYKKPDEATFSASDNLISEKRLTPTYNTAAVGKAEPAKPEVAVAVAPVSQKLENTVQVSGSGFG